MRRLLRWCVMTAMVAGSGLTGQAAGAGQAETGAPQSTSRPAGTLPRVVVEEFGWGSVTTSVQAAFGSHVDVGKGIRALVTTRLHDSGRIRLLDPTRNGPSPSAAAVPDVYLTGDIVTFGRDDRHRRVALGQFGLAGSLAGGLLSRREHKAVVTVAYRLVDAATGEVLAAGEASGESTRTSRSGGGLFGRRRGVAGGTVDMTSQNFSETLIGEAVIAAVDQMAAMLTDAVSSLAPSRG